ncbi:Cytochrome c oxidase subunit 2 [bacterium HR16]|nr:Cytochrome c oxidase subunit 2 [bacterium HR16]
MVQTIAFAIWAVIVLAILATYGYFAWSARTPLDGEEYYKAVARLRRPLFIVLVLLLAATLALTLPRIPYPRRDIVPDRVVHVVGKQFSFAVSEQPITTDADFARAIGERVRLPAGALVEFRVTSRDVNHGFAVYDPEGHLLGQTQAMPGYVNRLLMRFDKPGTYHALCLEYCGLAHHAMRGTFEVLASEKLARR